MKKLIVCALVSLGFIFSASAFADVGHGGCEIKGMILSMQKRSHSLGLDLYAVKPVKKRGSASCMVESNVHVNKVMSSGIDLSMLAIGDVVTGNYVMTKKKGYKAKTSLEIKKVCKPGKAKGYVRNNVRGLREIYKATDVSAMTNMTMVVRRYKIRKMLPDILSAMTALYPNGRWKTRDVPKFYNQGINSFASFKYKKAKPLLERIVQDKHNARRMGRSFKDVQGLARAVLITALR